MREETPIMIDDIEIPFIKASLCIQDRSIAVGDLDMRVRLVSLVETGNFCTMHENVILGRVREDTLFDMKNFLTCISIADRKGVADVEKIAAHFKNDVIVLIANHKIIC